MKHLKDNNETYFSHLFFAGKVGLYLLSCGIMFLLHGLLPISSVPKSLNLPEIKRKCKEWNDHTIERLFQ
jgi:hypothetical protein